MLGKRILTILVITLAFCSTLSAQTGAPRPRQLDQKFKFVRNKGQWKHDFLYRADLPAGNLNLYPDHLDYLFQNQQQVSLFYTSLHDHDANFGEEPAQLVDLHRFKVYFLEAQTDSVKIHGFKPTTDKRNYLRGKDASKWVKNIPAYNGVSYQNLYEGIDLNLYKSKKSLKYEFVVAPKTKTKQIKLKFEGAEVSLTQKGQLRIKTSVNEVIEMPPYAYQLVDGEEKEVPCHFELQGNVLGYHLGKYDKKLPLIIDPQLIFSTYSGSFADNWGSTACMDTVGNLYAGGIVFGDPTDGFPATIGAFQEVFHGASTDMGILKFDSAGTTLLYATYIGGSGTEFPTSLYAGDDESLYILGVSSSVDYPTTAGAYQPTNNLGAPTVTWFRNGVAVGNGVNANFVVSPGDSVYASLNLFSNVGCLDCGDQQSITLHFNQKYIKDYYYCQKDTLICTGSRATFEVCAQDDVMDVEQVEWLVNGVSSGVTAFVFQSDSMNEGDVVQAQITTFCDNGDTLQKNLRGLTISLDTNRRTFPIISNELCVGVSSDLEVDVPDELLPYTVEWLVNGTPTLTGTTFTGVLNATDEIRAIVRYDTSTTCANYDSISDSKIITANEYISSNTFPTQIYHHLCLDNGLRLVYLRDTVSGSDSVIDYLYSLNGGAFVPAFHRNGYVRIVGTAAQLPFSIQLGVRVTNNCGIDTVYSEVFVTDTDDLIYIEADNYDVCSNEMVNVGLSLPSFMDVTSVNTVVFRQGSDIVVTRLSPDGSTLIGSTFIGGTGVDGIISNCSPILRNYGDQHRGDINVDDLGNAYVATMTGSNDFPIVGGFQPVFGGGILDGVTFKLAPDMSNLIWSSYLGGDNDDAALSIQRTTAGDVVVAGGSISTNFPDNTPRGNVDGYVVKMSADASVMMQRSRVGTPEFDQAYFVQLDTDDDVYLLGQTLGEYPVTAGVYTNPRSGIFIHKLSSDLSTTVYSTVVGDTISTDDVLPPISPTAFLVNDCENLFLAGWGGRSNRNYNPGVTLNLPLTSNAFQSTSDGSDFYLMVLRHEADSLIYATYFGGAVSAEHVDGGTSRFDKSGIVYQSVCAGCGGNSDFPLFPTRDSTFGSYPSINNSRNCNNGVFKFDLAFLEANFEPLQECLDSTVVFANTSIGGIDFQWDFGDGSTLFTHLADTVTHTYADPGTYIVSLVATDLTTCKGTDLHIDTIHILDRALVTADTAICPGESVVLIAQSNSQLFWEPHPTIDFCLDPDCHQILVNPTVTTDYIVHTFSDHDTCVFTDTVTVIVDTSTLIVDFNMRRPCLSYTAMFENTSINATNFTWDFGDGTGINTNSTEPIIHEYDSIGIYTVQLTADHINGCATSQSTTQQLHIIDSIHAYTDTIICKGYATPLYVEGHWAPVWDDSVSLSCLSCHDPIATPEDSTAYVVRARTPDGCEVSDTVIVDMYPDQLGVNEIQVDQSRCYDDTVYFTGGIADNGCICCRFVDEWRWDFGDGNQDTGQVVSHLYDQEGDYQVVLQTFGQDTLSDTVMVIVYHTDSCLKNLYIPNAFTPNGDGENDLLYVRAINIIQLEFKLYDRIGEKVFETHSLRKGWDGTFKGQKMSQQVFVYTCTATFWDGEKVFKEGNITLLE